MGILLAVGNSMDSQFLTFDVLGSLEGWWDLWEEDGENCSCPSYFGPFLFPGIHSDYDGKMDYLLIGLGQVTYWDHAQDRWLEFSPKDFPENNVFAFSHWNLG